MYSVTLLAAMTATGIALVAAVAGLFRADAMPSNTVARAAGLLGILLAAGAIVLHFWTGHQPGTHDAMTAPAFLAEHAAPLVTMVVGFFSLWLASRREVTGTQIL